MSRDLHSAPIIRAVVLAALLLAAPLACLGEDAPDAGASIQAQATPKLKFHMAVAPEGIAEIIRDLRKAFPDHIEGRLKQDPLRPSQLVTSPENLNALKELFHEAAAQDIIPEDVRVCFSPPPKPEADQLIRVFFLDAAAIFNGEGIASAFARRDPSNAPYWKISFSLDDAAAQTLGDATEAHIDEAMAIVFDDIVLSSATIRDRITKSAEITGSFTEDEAKAIAHVLDDESDDAAMKASILGTLRAFILIILLTGTYVFVLRPRLRYGPRHRGSPSGARGENEDLDVVRHEGKDYRPD